VSEPEWGNFLACDVRIIAPPVLEASAADPVTFTFTLHWESSPPQAPARYLLEEATSADFHDAILLYSGPQTVQKLYGRPPGDYYYRVRVEIDGNSSDWSNGVVVRVNGIPAQELNSVRTFSSQALLAVHRALLRLCAARGDVFALLTLPEHYREKDAMAHATLLRARLGEAPATEDVAPFGYGEATVPSYGAVFHPWLINREDTVANAPRRTPVCGTMGGVFAQRALRRGAWIAPANEPLRGVLALEPRIAEKYHWSLQEARVNLVRQEPRGFVVLDADTLALAEDEALRPINVRRLLSLLRRLALRLGATYVFEPNDAPFRRAVRRGFEAMLEQLFVRGAFAGATSATSYQVAVDDTLNPPAVVEQGRFVVELRVAPSLPMTFLTLRLVQTGDRGLLIEG
jgi:phage tail sheath protein FI